MSNKESCTQQRMLMVCPRSSDETMNAAFSLCMKRKKVHYKIYPAFFHSAVLESPCCICYTSSSHTRALATNTKERGARLVRQEIEHCDTATRKEGLSHSPCVSFVSPRGQPGNDCFMDSMNADGQMVIRTEQRLTEG